MAKYAILTKSGLYSIAEDNEPAPTDVSWEDVDAAIEEDGWCGTHIDSERVVVIGVDDYGSGLPDAANDYLSPSAYVVRIDNWMGYGSAYWLRRTVWTSERDRATVFASHDEAQTALDHAKKFNPKAAKAAKIVKE